MADLDSIGCIDTEKRTDTVVHGIVHERNLIYFRSLSDIDCVTTGTGDAIHVAGIEYESSYLDYIVVVSIEESRKEVRDFAIQEFDLIQFGSTSGMFNDTGSGNSVEFYVFEIELGFGFGQIRSKLNLTLNDWFRSVGTEFSDY